MRRLLPAAMGLGLALIAIPRYSAAQAVAAASVTLRDDQAASFTQAFQAIAEQAHVAILAEGEPLHRALDKEKAQRLQIKNLAPRAAIDKVADAFDYDVTYGNGVYQLTKRFTDPHDMPEVFLPEWQQSVQDMLKILNWYSPHLQSVSPDSGKPEPLAAYLMATLTPEQLDQMKEDKGGLAVASLTPEQQAAVWQAARWFYLQIPEDDLKNGARDLNKMARPQGAFCYRQEAETRYFGLSFPATVTQQTGPTPSQPFLSLARSPSGHTYNRLLFIYTKPMSDIEPPDPSDDPVPSEDAPPPPSVAQTLGQLASSLNALRNENDTGHKVTMAVDPILAEKPVSVFGVSWANPQDIFVAAGRIYSLRVEDAKTASTVTLKRATVDVRPNRVEDVPDLIRRVFPAPFQRVVQQDRSLSYSRDAAASMARMSDLAKRSRAPDLSEAQKNELKVAIRAEQQSWMNARLAGMRALNGSVILAEAALHVMRVRLNTKLKGDREVLVSESDPQCQMALSLYSLACTLQSLKWVLKDKPPAYITDFANSRIVGGVTTNAKGKQEFSLNLAVPNPALPHSFDSPVGASGMPYIK